MEFSVYASRPIPDLHFGIFDEEGILVDSRELSFRSGGRSITYDYEGPKRIIFFTPKKVRRDDGQTTIQRNVKASASIPQNLTKALIVFMQKPASERVTGEPSHNVLLIDDSESALPWGGLAIYNATTVTLLGSVENGESSDGKRISINSGQNPPSLIAPTGSVRLAYKFKDEFWQLVYAKTFSCSVNERILLLILPPRSKGARQVRGAVITDRINPTE